MADQQIHEAPIHAPPAHAQRRLPPEAALLLITILWASNFFVTQLALQECRPLGFLALRFSTASLALLLFFPTRMQGLTRTELRAGLAIGVTLFFAFVPQTVGLLYIPIAKSAFIIAIYVPLVPVLQLLLLRKVPRFVVWIGIAFAFIGLILLSADEGLELGFGIGEWLTLGAAVACALQIVLLGRWAQRTDPFRLAFVQIVVVAVCCFAAMAAIREPFPQLTGSVLGAAVELGVIGTAFIFAVMNWAQRSVSPARATVIYAAEPVWAAVIGMLAGEGLNRTAIVGAMLIVTGVLVSELRCSGSSVLRPESSTPK
jgi:drug/metabolite transporter (DMT)-like permease